MRQARNQHEAGTEQGAAFLTLFFEYDDASDMFLLQVGSLSTYNYTEFYTRRHNFPRVILLDS
jgi:hypothetical protein